MSCCSSHELRRVLAGALLTLSVAVAAGLVPAAASASSHARALCVNKVTVRDSPYGYAIGHLFRPQRLTVLHEGIPRWALIRSRAGLVGWISEKALCPAARR